MHVYNYYNCHVQHCLLVVDSFDILQPGRKHEFIAGQCQQNLFLFYFLTLIVLKQTGEKNVKTNEQTDTNMILTTVSKYVTYGSYTQTEAGNHTTEIQIVSHHTVVTGTDITAPTFSFPKVKINNNNKNHD